MLGPGSFLNYMQIKGKEKFYHFGPLISQLDPPSQKLDKNPINFARSDLQNSPLKHITYEDKMP